LYMHMCMSYMHVVDVFHPDYTWSTPQLVTAHCTTRVL
jgi:hypothetical protein